MLSIKAFCRILVLFSIVTFFSSIEAQIGVYTSRDINEKRYDQQIYYWDQNIYNENSSLPGDGGGGFDDDDDQPPSDTGGGFDEDDEPVSIDQGIFILLIVAFALCIYFIHNQKKIKNVN